MWEGEIDALGFLVFLLNINDLLQLLTNKNTLELTGGSHYKYYLREE